MSSHQLSVIISKTVNKGKGVLANINFKQGEIVIVGKPVERLPQRTWQTLQMDIDVHLTYSPA
ncbi:MAG: hypothetical protein F6K24_29675 [Okeania sp. SIO2D1]|nr:hypothetical protein [Okeania sp. SIO2D1]